MSTLRGYASHIRLHLKPFIGHALLDELSTDDLQVLFTTLARTPTEQGRTRQPSTLHRIRATLRVALNTAVTRGLIASNPARRVELPPANRPKAVVWTEPVVAHWRATGEHPPVAVWTAEQTARFLTHHRRHRQFPVLWLIALVGLRRGEACGLRWCDVDLDRRQLYVRHQLQHTEHGLELAPTKTTSSVRIVALDHATARILRDHQTHTSPDGTGFVFLNAHGDPLAPDRLTTLFRDLVRDADQPPVRLHDLRHGAASLSLAAGNDLRIVQATLGHSSIVLTADTYTSVLPTLAHQAAEATARQILRTEVRTYQRFRTRAQRHRTWQKRHPKTVTHRTHWATTRSGPTPAPHKIGTTR